MILIQKISVFYTWIWFQPSSSLMGIVQMKGFTLQRKEILIEPKGKIMSQKVNKFAWWWIDSLTPWTFFAHFCHPKPVSRGIHVIQIMPVQTLKYLKMCFHTRKLYKRMISYLNLKCEVLFHVLDDHDKVGKLDSQGFLGIWKNLKYQLFKALTN